VTFPWTFQVSSTKIAKLKIKDFVAIGILGARCWRKADAKETWRSIC